MKLKIDIDDNDYELLNKTGITIDLNTAFHGKEKDREMTFAIINLVKALKNGTPISNEDDLISRSELKKALHNCFDGKVIDEPTYILRDVFCHINNAPTVEVPENAVNCVLTMFGDCSYNKTGCSDCEIKDKIRTALKERT